VRPVHVGDVRGVVAEVALDRDGLEWLAYKLPADDEFTKELFDALGRVDAQLEIESELFLPQLHVLLERS